MKTIRIALLASVCLIGPTVAQEMKVDLTKLPPEVAAALVKAVQDQKNDLTLPTTVEQAEQYAKIGEHVAKAVAATAKGLSIEANEFIKTPVGWWTFIFVFWYLLGAKLWHIVGGIMFWIASSAMIWKSSNSYFKPRKRLVSENGKEKTYEYQEFPWKSSDAKAMAGIMHFLTFVACTITSLVLIF